MDFQIETLILNRLNGARLAVASRAPSLLAQGLREEEQNSDALSTLPEILINQMTEGFSHGLRTPFAFNAASSESLGAGASQNESTGRSPDRVLDREPRKPRSARSRLPGAREQSEQAGCGGKTDDDGC